MTPSLLFYYLTKGDVFEVFILTNAGVMVQYIQKAW